VWEGKRAFAAIKTAQDMIVVVVRKENATKENRPSLVRPETAWLLCTELRSAMVAPDRTRLKDRGTQLASMR
jgi:hypothetical protein